MEKAHFRKSVGSIVLQTVKPGIYKGLAANEIGKKCVEAMVDHLKILLSKLSAKEVVKTAYNIHEEYAYAMFDPLGKIYFSRKYNFAFSYSSEFEKAMTKLGVNSRFLVEAGLSYGGPSGIPSKEDMDYAAVLVDCTVTWARNLDLFYYSSKLFPDFQIEVTNTGHLLFTHDQKLVDQQESVIRKFALEREAAHFPIISKRASTIQLSKEVRRNMFYDRYTLVNEVYKSRFGYKFTDVLKFLAGISDLLPENRPFGIHINNRKKLLKKLSANTRFPLQKTKKMLEDFEITRDELMKEGFPNWRFKRKFSLLWKPIVSVSMGTRKICSVTGKITPIGNISMLVTSLEGFLNLGKSTEEIRRKKAKKFEGDVAEVLTLFGFKTRLNVKSPKGEIDVVAILRNLILVVECKSPTFKIDVRKHIQDLKDSQEWEKKLEKKLVWVRDNKTKIFEEIARRKTPIKGPALLVKGVIVTHRPFYDILDQKFDIVFWQGFPRWLRKLTWG